MIGYSPQFPLLIDNNIGAYAINTTLRQVIVQNFKNLLLTSPGERIMDRNFGVGLKHFLFEQNTPFLQGQIAATIQDQKAAYMDFLNIHSIEFNKGITNLDEGVLLSVVVNFSIPRAGSASIGVGSPTNL